MLPEVQVQKKSLKKYRGLVSQGLFNEIRDLSSRMRGIRVYMVNATPRGGGVAEMLESLIPLLRDVGIHAKWFTIPPKQEFFEVTKNIHNALQSKPWDFPFSARKIYLDHMRETAVLMQDMEPDIWVIHDPQPAGVVLYLDLHRAILRIHIDLTEPNKAVWKFISGFAQAYDRVVVSSRAFIRPEIASRAIIFHPAIDAFSAKNQPVDVHEAEKMVGMVGINLSCPLVVQVSRFDPWKDPLGVIEAYKIAKKKIANLQLALVGFMEAQDDPEAARIYEMVKKAARSHKDIFLLEDPRILRGKKIGVFTNAIQALADVVVQNSTKEGFGLVVTEAMWKEKAVIGGIAEGMRTQIRDGENGFLVHNPREMARCIIQLIHNKELREKVGKRARESVRRNFLMPRLVRDYLQLFHGLLAPRKQKGLQTYQCEVR